MKPSAFPRLCAPQFELGNHIYWPGCLETARPQYACSKAEGSPVFYQTIYFNPFPAVIETHIWHTNSLGSLETVEIKDTSLVPKMWITFSWEAVKAQFFIWSWIWIKPIAALKDSVLCCRVPELVLKTLLSRFPCQLRCTLLSKDSRASSMCIRLWGINKNWRENNLRVYS